MVFWAKDIPCPATIILISGDGGFAPMVAALRLRGYTVVVILPPGKENPRLKSQASQSLCWLLDVCGRVRGNKEERLSQALTPNSAGPLLTHRKLTASSPTKSVAPVAALSEKKVCSCLAVRFSPAHQHWVFRDPLAKKVNRSSPRERNQLRRQAGLVELNNFHSTSAWISLQK